MHKKFLIQAFACNLALLLRSRHGFGKPRAAHDGAAEAFLIIFAVLKDAEGHSGSPSAIFPALDVVFRLSTANSCVLPPDKKEGFETRAVKIPGRSGTRMICTRNAAHTTHSALPGRGWKRICWISAGVLRADAR